MTHDSQAHCGLPYFIQSVDHKTGTMDNYMATNGCIRSSNTLLAQQFICSSKPVQFSVGQWKLEVYPLSLFISSPLLPLDKPDSSDRRESETMPISAVKVPPNFFQKTEVFIVPRQATAIQVRAAHWARQIAGSTSNKRSTARH